MAIKKNQKTSQLKNGLITCPIPVCEVFPEKWRKKQVAFAAGDSFTTGPTKRWVDCADSILIVVWDVGLNSWCSCLNARSFSFSLFTFL